MGFEQLRRDASCFFVTVATILGTGILGLPVKLAHTGFWPLAATFAVVLCMQLAVVLLMCELLQEAKLRLLSSGAPADAAKPSEYQQLDGDGGELHRASASPDLHTMGKMFLGPTSRLFFDIAVMFHFVFILISYGLSGSQAIGELIGVSSELLLTPFVVCLAFVVILFSRHIVPLIGAMTSGKFVLLIVMVACVGYVAIAKLDAGPSDSWRDVLAPFLMGTVALGGAVNLMPVLFQTVPFRAECVRRFRMSVSAGVFACWALNMLWAFFVLRVVPQTREKAAAEGLDASLEQAEDDGEISTVPVSRIIRQRFDEFDWVAYAITSFILVSICVSFITLSTGMKHVLDGFVAQRRLRALQNRQGARGQSRPKPSLESYGSTESQRPDTGWSGAALHALDLDAKAEAGASPDVDIEVSDVAVGADVNDISFGTMLPSPPQSSPTVPPPPPPLDIRPPSSPPPPPTLPPEPALSYRNQRWLLYFVFWGLVWAVCMASPKGLLDVLELFTSAGLNTEAGLFIGMMLRNARRSRMDSHSPRSASASMDIELLSNPATAQPQSLLPSGTEPSTPPSPPTPPRRPELPLPLSAGLAAFLAPFTMVTFLGAVIYDAVTAGLDNLGVTGFVSAVVMCAALAWELWGVSTAFPRAVERLAQAEAAAAPSAWKCLRCALTPRHAGRHRSGAVPVLFILFMGGAAVAASAVDCRSATTTTLLSIAAVLVKTLSQTVLLWAYRTAGYIAVASIILAAVAAMYYGNVGCEWGAGLAAMGTFIGVIDMLIVGAFMGPALRRQ